MSDNIENLKVRIKELENKLSLREKNFNKLIQEAIGKGKEEVLIKKTSIKKTTDEIIIESNVAGQKEGWEKIVDEIAHSINTDVDAAIKRLDEITSEDETSSENLKLATNRIKNIRDITNLHMWYLKRDELNISHLFKDVDLKEVLNQQINTIKDGIETLKLSTKIHQENLKNLIINFECSSTFVVNENIKNVIDLIIKDILKNCFKNTDKERPEVNILITDFENKIEVKFENNKKISENIIQWFNGDNTIDPDNIQKSSKVGLRIIKKWANLLKIQIKFSCDDQKEITTTLLTLPKNIVYEKN